ncbi:formimidoylglutamate deiminase, partial [Sphingomonas sp.]|uniref:formimidoylglutamate deiminase n=1 Tax=Sphingomonas sp. TaxID=28214 RepID=UPI002C07F557
MSPSTQPPSDLVLHAGVALLPQGWCADVRLTIAEGRLVAVEAGVAASPQDEAHAVILPGMPNLHSHAFQRGMAGLAEARGPGEDSFWTWRDAMYRFVDRIGPEQLTALAALAYAEMLESGFTRVGEFHYLHHDRDGTPFADPAAMGGAIVAAAAETGIGLTLLPVFYAHAGFDRAPPAGGQRRFATDVDRFARLLESSRGHAAGLPDASVGVAPHSLRAVTPDELLALTALAGDAPIHIHIAEQRREVEECLRWSGARPVQWLLDHAPVAGNWCLVHATHMTATESADLAASGAVAGLCPITEANLGDGLFPAEPYLGAGGRIGIGSDSNVAIDCAGELRLLEYGQRLISGRRSVLADAETRSPGEYLFRRALAGGGQALGVGAAGLSLGQA